MENLTQRRKGAKVCFMLRIMCLAFLFAFASPCFAQEIRSAKSGDWSSPATWDGGKVPGAGSRVLIRTGHAVRYDVVSRHVIRVVHVAGTLTLRHDRNTLLDVSLLG